LSLQKPFAGAGLRALASLTEVGPRRLEYIQRQSPQRFGKALRICRLPAQKVCYAAPVHAPTPNSRHSVLVRVTHWLTVLALLLTGAELIISHPRFYWGETGNVNMRPLFAIPIPSSRDTVPTGYNYVMPDQNGWSRYLHFQAAWLLVLTALLYGINSVVNGHFRKDLLPPPAKRNLRAIGSVFARYLRRAPADPNDSRTYNVVQQIAYLTVIFVLFPLIIWTGLAMSPSFTSAFPIAVLALGGRQSARTLHFFDTIALVLFLIVHVAMVSLSGFRTRMRAMTLGDKPIDEAIVVPQGLNSPLPPGLASPRET
jgi:thiosulfate reductase cytochrome b subunit